MPENPCENYPPVAIVGMAMRLPGGVRTDKDFWDLMVNKRDGGCKVPESRYNVDAFYSDKAPHSVKSDQGYFLQDDPACFDNGFFSMGEFEASRLDPQQRLLLEIAWECMEDAGQSEWRSSDIGCYVGVFGEDWLDLSSKDPQQIGRLHALGTGNFALSNRISYEYDLTGPSITYQTGCSSSLVALHEACRALHAGECSSAIVGGTNLIFTPTMTTTMSDNMVMAHDGRCRTFDKEANGYGRGEGINAIYIKPLQTALRDGDRIRAVIRATATNCDGKTPSITTPGSSTQKQLIRRAYQTANIDQITDTPFFELHGTGTKVGDVAETSVIADLFSGEQATYIGTVKPNVGHSEGASGLTSVIKAVLALENQIIPPNINFENPNPEIPFGDGKLEVPLEPVAWPQGRKERISVNCFGIGGANAHAILDSARSYCEPIGRTLCLDTHSTDAHLLLVSAASPTAVGQRAKDLQQYINAHSPDIQDVAYTLANRLTHMAYRTFLLVNKGKPIQLPEAAPTKPAPRELIFIFTGQGAQWPGMAKELMMWDEGFRTDIRKMDETLRGLQDPPEWSIEEELLAATSACRLSNAEFSQPICTAVQIGIINLLARLGITPHLVVGHSSGEIAAAYAAKAISQELSVIISYYRGRAAKACRKGAMAAVAVDRATIQNYIAGEDGVMIACENGPRSFTISGEEQAVSRVVKGISNDHPDVLCRRLPVDVAYHSHYMRDVGDDFETMIQPHMRCNEATVPFYSTVRQSLINSSDQLTAKYWRENLESPVLFSGTIDRILKDDNYQRPLFLEIGPHSALAGPIRQITHAASNDKTAYIPTLRRNRSSIDCVLETVGQLWAHGVSMDLEKVARSGHFLTDLPSYPWEHGQRFWNESSQARSWRLRQFPNHELLGSRLLGSSDLEPTWRSIVTIEDVPWLADHRIIQDIVFPGAGYIAMVGEAIRQLTGSTAYTIKGLCLRIPLFLVEMASVEIVTSLKPTRLTDVADSEWYDFTIMSYDRTTWVRHCQGRACGSPAREGYDTAIQSFTRRVPSNRWYNFMAKHGLRYGPSFQGLEDITADPVSRRATGAAAEYQSENDSHYSLHPVIIDEALQLLAVAVCSGRRRGVDRIGVPARFNELYIGKANERIQLEASSYALSTAMMGGSAVGVSKVNKVVLSVQDGAFMSLEPVAEAKVPITSHIEWKPDINVCNKQELLPFSPRGVSGELVMLHTILCIVETFSRVESLTAVSAHLDKYREWLRKTISNVVSRGDHIATRAQQWITINSTARTQAFENLASLVHPDQQDHTNVLNLQRQIIGNVVDVFSGGQSPVECLMQHDLLAKLYSTRSFQHAWHTCLSALSHSDPRMRVLEVGAGTGGSTEIALECLCYPDGSKGFSSYTFTDISSGFFSSARARFQNNADLEYRTLDINADPVEQGFEEGGFDLVIAANVLHATDFIGKSLQHIRKLLKPGGYLLLQELCPETPALDCIMGILPGWWVGSDDGRAEKPYITSERWHIELLNSGFTGSEAETFDDVRPFHQAVNILTQKPYPNSPDKSVTLVSLFKPGNWASKLSKRLIHQGYAVEWTDIQGTVSTHGVIVLVDLEGPFLNTMTPDDYNNLQRLLSACAHKQVLWVMPPAQSGCQDPNYGLVPGFARSIRRELCPELATLEVDTLDTSSAGAAVRVYEQFVLLSVNHAKRDHEYVLHQDVIYVGRYHWASIASRYPQPDSYLNRKLAMETPGILDTMHWVAVNDSDPVQEAKVEVDVKYCGLNFMDLMVSMGIVGTADDFGLECSGIVRRVGANVQNVVVGDRVVVAGLGVLRNRITVPQELCIKIPEGLSLEDASTMPTVYATAIYSLVTQGNLKEGQSVLIHSACGGVGLAAIHICQTVGAKIFATVGSEEKTQYLEETFGISRERIFNSRNATFLPAIMKATENRGVDLVLNSLAGDLLHASWECVAKCGKMIELGKRDFIGHGALDMHKFLGNRTFCGVDLITLGQECPDMLKSLFAQWISWLGEGKVRPIRPVTVFQAADVVDAFRYMQSGNHIGKIVIKMPDEGTELPVSNPKPRFSLRSDAAYLLVGGLGGLGQAISNWMVEHGARHLIYLSRTAGFVEQHKGFVRELEVQGCQVTMVPGDVTNISDVQRAIDSTRLCVRGLIQMSMVLNDKSFSNMTFEEWRATLNPKVTGTWNLHNASLKQPLDFFVVLSSITGLCGNQGQSNYAAANTFLDSFVQYRQNMGLPASVLDLGFVEDIGCVSQTPEILQRMYATSLYALQEQELMDALQLALASPQASAASGNNVPSSSILAIGLGCTRPLNTSGVIPPWNRDDVRFCGYENIDIDTASDEADISSSLRQFLDDVKMNPAILDDPETESRITQELAGMIISHTGRDRDMDEEQMAAIAIDSLMSLEIKSWFRRKLSLELALSDISKAGTIGGLSKMTIELLRKRYTAQEGQVA